MGSTYWENRAHEIRGAVPAEGIDTEQTAWLNGKQEAENALERITYVQARLDSTSVLGLDSRAAFAETLVAVRTQLEQRVEAYRTGREAAGLAQTARENLHTAIGNAPGTDAGPGPDPLSPQQPDEDVDAYAQREAEHSSAVSQHQGDVAALEQAREEHFRRAVLAFETDMYRAADKYAEIDTRPREGGGGGGGAGAPGSSAVPPSRIAELVAVTDPDRGDDGVVVDPDRPDHDPSDPDRPPYDPTLPPDLTGPDGSGGSDGSSPGSGDSAAPGGSAGGLPISGGGIAAGVGSAAVGVGAGVGLVRAIRGGATIGAAGAPPAVGRGGLASSALGRSGASAVPPAQGRGGAASTRGGGGIGRNGALGRGGAPVSGSRGTRTIGGSALGRSGAAGSSGGKGAGGAAAGKGASKGSGKGSNPVSGSRGTRTIGGSGAAAGAASGRRGKGDDAKDPQQIHLYDADDWLDDEPTGPPVLD